jgi:hypothetical protein
MLYSQKIFALTHSKPKIAQIIFKDSVRTAKKTQLFTITKINWLMLFKEIIPVCTENRTKPTNANAALLIVESDGTYSYRSASKV